jgi:hypothetical protein
MAAKGSAQWTQLAQSVVSLFMSNSPQNAAVAGVALLGALVDATDEQARILESIDRNVQLLRGGPFNAGTLMLQEAHRLAGGPQRRQSLLESARDRFYDAHGLTNSSYERGLVEVNLGAVWLLLGSREDAQRWFFLTPTTPSPQRSWSW